MMANEGMQQVAGTGPALIAYKEPRQGGSNQVAGKVIANDGMQQVVEAGAGMLLQAYKEPRARRQ